MACKLIEAAAESSDELMDKFFSGDELVRRRNARVYTCALKTEIILVTCGSAFKNKGVQAMLDAVIDYLPAPTDIEAIKGINPYETEGERHASDDETVCVSFGI